MLHIDVALNLVKLCSGAADNVIKTLMSELRPQLPCVRQSSSIN